jgi:DNA repair protein RecN (Recombination protein N)
VLCVTHLAQVAAHAGSHLKVEKRLAGGRTFTEVRALGEEERKREVARMLAGEAVTPLALEHAAELLAAAHAHLELPGDRTRGRPGSRGHPAADAGRRVAPTRSAARTVSARRRAG